MAHHRAAVSLALALVIVLALFPTQSVHAAVVFTVNNRGDSVDINPGNSVCADASGQCTLRAAIMEANAWSGADTINVPNGTITLTLPGRDENNAATGDLDITDAVTITGAAGNAAGDPTLTIIQAGTDATNGIDKVFSINPNFDKAFTTTLQALTIRYGYNSSSDPYYGYGGGLDWDAGGSGKLNITNCIITDNTAVHFGGGGLYTSNESHMVSSVLVTITRSTFTNNRTLYGVGGGISMGSDVPFTMTDSVVRNNTASTDAVSDLGQGGGLYFSGAAIPSIISGSTFSGNTALGRDASIWAGAGGGIYAVQGTAPGMLQISNSTISGNSATGSGGGALLMGVELNSVTITGNNCRSTGYASGSGGGIDTANDSGGTYLRNTIVAGNTCGGTGNDLSGAFNRANSYSNLIGNPGNSGFSNGTNGNLVNVTDARLGPLANNGGLTQTHALLPGSPALDAGSDTYAANYDQRGANFPRRTDAADSNTTKTVDIGAFEAYPMIEDMPNRTVFANTTSRFDFYFGDSSLALPTFAATSSNTVLVPNSGANLSTAPGSGGGIRTLTIIPVANQTGTTTITVTATHPTTGLIVSDTFVLTVVATPDLSVTKTHSGNFWQGQTGAVFTLTVRNLGQGAVSGTVTLTDSLPNGLTATGMSGSGWTCNLPTLTCTRSDGLAGGASFPAVTLTVDVSRTAPASVTNTASVSNTGDTNTGNNSASDTVTIDQQPDLTVTKTHSGDFRQGQSAAEYLLTVNNMGTGATSGVVTLTDSPPSGLSAAELSGTGWTCALGSFTCTRSDALAAGSSYPPVTLKVNVAADAPAALTNTASVAGGGETNTTNNSASDPTTIIQAADLSLAIHHGGDLRQGQTGAVYGLEVSNTGAGLTTGEVTLSAGLPAGLSATAMSGEGWTCTLATLTCTRSDALAPSSGYPPVALTVDVAVNAAPQVTLTGTVSGGGELNTANNTAGDLTTVIQAADLAVSKTHTGSFNQAQSGAVFTLIVSNIGPGPTTGTVALQDLLPAALTARELSGTGWSCTLATLTCTRSDALAAGSSYPAVTLTVDVTAGAPAEVVNQAQVSGGGELVTGNDSASDTVMVIQLPDLTISKSHSGNLSQGQTDGQYLLRVGNTGHAPVSGLVSVTDNLPAGLTAVSMSGEGWACVLAALTCARSDGLVDGAYFPDILLTVRVADDAPALVTNQASVSGVAELSTSNNTASDPAAVAQAPDLTVSKSHSGVFKQGQIGAVYTLTVTNSGGSPTSGTVTLMDELPSGLTAASLSGEGWNCNLASLTCTRADALAAGASYPAVTLIADVSPDAPGNLTNTAHVEGGSELVTGNNSASDLTRVYTRPVISLQPESQSIWIGQPASLSAAAGGDPAPTVQWQSSSDGEDWSDLEGETSTTLTFIMAAEFDGRQFRAVFTNEMGSATTDAAVMRMNFAPVIDQHPASQAVRASRNVVFTVKVRAVPEAEIIWQVSTDGGISWTDLPDASGSTLTLVARREMDGYQYRAVVWNTGGTEVSNAAVLVVDENRMYFPLVWAPGP